MLKPLVQALLEQNTGILQLPCPEHTFLGISRLGQTKEQYDTLPYRQHCERILEPIIESIKDYQANHYRILGVVGIKGSPSCGIVHTYSDKGKGGGSFRGSGVFIEVLKEMLRRNKLELAFVEMDEENVYEGLKKVEQLLK
jgi:predicted secreted protein